jgi:hypothetical protein
MPKVELKRIAVKRFAVVFGIVQAIIGLVYGLSTALSSLAFISPSVSYILSFVAPYILTLGTGVAILSFLIPETVMLSFPVPPMFSMVVMMLVGGLLIGFFQGAVLAWLYNLIAGRFGGLIFIVRFSFLEPELYPIPAKVSGKKNE